MLSWWNKWSGYNVTSGSRRDSKTNRAARPHTRSESTIIIGRLTQLGTKEHKCHQVIEMTLCLCFSKTDTVAIDSLQLHTVYWKCPELMVARHTFQHKTIASDYRSPPPQAEVESVWIGELRKKFGAYRINRPFRCEILSFIGPTGNV